jgi:peptide/nickel transport system substrate-binding protein
MVSPKAADAEGKDFALHPVCAGPFKFTERVPQDRIVLDRFPQYWNAGAIHFARVVYQPIVDSTARLAALQAGSIDLSEQVLPTDADTVTKNPNLKLVTSPYLGYTVIDMNVGKGAGKRFDTPLGRDARVRKAFELSLDRAALVQVVYNGIFTPTAQPIPAGSPFHDDALAVPQRDVAKAKALLADAGVKTPYQVELMLSNSPDIQQLGVVIQSMAAEAGFDVKLHTTEFATALDTADRGDYQMFLEGWSGRADPDGNTYNFLHSNGPLNEAGYGNPKMDGWLEEARTITDIPQRRALYAKVSELAEQDLPELYLLTPKNIVGMSAKLSGFVPVPDGMIRIQGMRMAP